MTRLVLFHWNEAEALDRAARLKALGYEVAVEAKDGGQARALRNDPPHGVVIDLSRLPSHGRDLGVYLRTSKATRQVPLIFVGGTPAKVSGIARLLPDAVFTTWDEVEVDLAEAIAHPPSDPVVPASNLAGYSGTPLPKKLGVKAGTTVGLSGAPDGFDATLGRLPEDVRLAWDDPDDCDLRIWFVRWRDDLLAGVAGMALRVPSGGLWIAWPKKAGRIESDVTEPQVREAGLSHGLVDYKVCAIDRDWSGLKFAVRK